MMALLKKIIILGVLVAAGMLLWQQRAKLAPLTNNHLLIQGTWYRVEFDRKGIEPYEFTERIIVLNGVEWGSYEMPKNNEIEVMVDDQLSTYRLEFPDEDNMIWWGEVEGKEVPVVSWRR
jgi:hypothetical protein